MKIKINTTEPFHYEPWKTVYHEIGTLKGAIRESFYVYSCDNCRKNRKRIAKLIKTNQIIIVSR